MISNILFVLIVLAASLCVHVIRCKWEFEDRKKSAARADSELIQRNLKEWKL